MNSAEKDIKDFFLRSMSETFSQVRRYLNHVEYDQDKLLFGLQEICGLFGLQVMPDEKVEPKIVAKPHRINAKHHCRNCVNGNVSYIRWEQGQRICAECFWRLGRQKKVS
jgi:hypothetical protein